MKPISSPPNPIRQVSLGRGVALSLLLLAALTGCSIDPCPAGMVRNATGDCVAWSADDGDQDQGSGYCAPGWLHDNFGRCIDPATLAGDSDGTDLDPCPPGWRLGNSGQCEPTGPTDGDGGESEGPDSPDGSEEEPSPDGDDSEGSDAPDTDTPGQPVCDQADDPDCPIGTVCHLAVKGGTCLPPCRMPEQCALWMDNSFCNSAQRCVPDTGTGTCAEDIECPYGEVCHPDLAQCAEPCSSLGDCQHFGTNYFCNSLGHCTEGEPQTTCTLDEQCESGKVCHPQLKGGTCLAPCAHTFECTNVESGTICNALTRCIPETADPGCDTLAECEIGSVCHAQMDEGAGKCLAPCTGYAFCQYYDPAFFCNSAALCAPLPSGSGCADDLGCALGFVCHDRAVEGGICAVACSDHDDCALLGSGLACNTFFHCVPDIVIPDGDVEPDGDVAPDGDLDDIDDADTTDTAEPDEEELCLQVGHASVYTVNAEMVSLSLTLKKGAGIYYDPTSKTSVYLRDNETGSQFKVLDAVSDGGSLPPISVIKGNYNVVVQNALGQRATVLENLNLVSNQGLEASLPFYTVVVHLRKNGQVFPSLFASNRGQITLYDRTLRREILLGETGGGVSDYSIEVFSSTFDALFAGFLSDEGSSYQEHTLLSNDRVTENREYTFNLQTVAISGDILVNGGTPPTDEEGRGEIWLLNPVRGNRFFFWDLGKSGAVSYSREIIADTYTIGFVPSGANGDAYVWKLSPNVDWTSTVSDEEIDIPMIRFHGGVKGPSGAALPDHAVLSRGSIWLTNEQNQEKRFLVDLGYSGEVNFDLMINPGTYTLYFEGPLLDLEWFSTHSWPPITHRIPFKTGVSLTTGTLADILLPFLNISGEITLDGQPVSIGEGSEYLTVRRASAGDDLAIVHFPSLAGSSYSALLFPGAYDMRYTGSLLLGSFQNFYALPEFVVDGAHTTHDVALRSTTLTVDVKAKYNGQVMNLSNLVDQGIYDSAEIHVIDEQIRNRTTGAAHYNEQGLFLLTRPPGTYTLILRLGKGAHYQEYPVSKNLVVTEDRAVSVTVDLVTLAVQVLKNGLDLPDSTNGQNRGDLMLRTQNDYLVIVSYDFDSAGPVNGVLTLRPDAYQVYLSVGFGDAFPFPQWKYVGCLNVVGPTGREGP